MLTRLEYEIMIDMFGRHEHKIESAMQSTGKII